MDTDFSDGAGIAWKHLESWQDGVDPLQKECHCRILCEDFACGKDSKIGQCQRGNQELVFPTQMQDASAGHQDLEGGTCLQKIVQQRSCPDDLLKIIKQQQQGFIAQEGLQQF